MLSLSLLINFSKLSAGQYTSSKDVILTSRNDGMFSILFDVFYLVRAYEKQQFNSVKVDFGSSGLYFEKGYGLNWWSYYFEPISYGIANKINTAKVNGDDGHPLIFPYNIPYGMELAISREEANALIKKHIIVKPYILKDVDQFVSDHFSGYTTIGVHYRGTDKMYGEAPKLKYEKALKVIKLHIKKLAVSDYKIFVATDEQDFIEFMLETFGDKICFNMDAARSTNGKPLHKLNKSPYKHGLEALMDCLLLSRTDLLIRTSSNLSLFSTYFNIDLPVVELTKRR